MKRSILMFLVIGTAIIFFGCSGDNPMAPKLNQSDPMAKELSQSDQVPTSLAKKPAPSLSYTIDYVLYLGLPEFDAEGRILVWDGNIHGDIEGKILWYFVEEGAGPPNMPPTAHVGFYEAGWEIWIGDDLLLAGESSGKTTMPKGKDGIWRGNGIVTEASAEYGDWIDRHTIESGNVNWTFPFSGEGIFRIN